MSPYSGSRKSLFIKRFTSSFLCSAIVLFPLLISNVEAQLPTSDMLQQLQQSRGSLGSMGGQNQPQQPPSVTIQPAVTLNHRVPLDRSRLEQIISYRAGAKLQQFGYDQLGQGQAVTIPMSGAIQDNYILGSSDEIIVSLRGQENNEFRVIVDRNGQVIIPRLKPISAAGRSLGIFRVDLEAAVQRSYVATNVSVSVGRVRQVSVLVSGEVNQPGQRLVTGLSSALDALLLSGGVKKNRLTTQYSYHAWWPRIFH